jgi:hypothetical protein
MDFIEIKGFRVIFSLLLSGNKRSKNAFPDRRLPAREAGIGQMGLPALKNFSPLVLGDWMKGMAEILRRLFAAVNRTPFCPARADPARDHKISCENSEFMMARFIGNALHFEYSSILERQ